MNITFSREEFFSANPPGITDILSGKSVFIAGAGGLGSNVAGIMARSGIGHLTIADFDTVSPSNMNRQQFFYSQIGMKKADAIKENLSRINPFMELKTVSEKLSPENFETFIPDTADIIFECFDNPVSKAELSRFCLEKRAGIPLIAVSGIAGTGPAEEIKISRPYGNFYVIGDGNSDTNVFGVLASRVILAAALQSHLAIRIMRGP
ncbi:MAG: thiamine biosynthesis protein ThiF [Lentisphaerae bacterium GWF2_44_16]|nr:MAG: thiamine biosynthesis protein ThiF [Lentisphaerae bacterium GWF2_44_16]